MIYLLLQLYVKFKHNMITSRRNLSGKYSRGGPHCKLFIKQKERKIQAEEILFPLENAKASSLRYKIST